jgi:multicomponent Na+:H+ antiporter subunit B
MSEDGGDRWAADGSDGGEGAVLTGGDTTIIARTVARVVAPLILLTSVSLLFQGHNLPGGGFIGGVLTATAFALLYIVYDLEYIQNTVTGVAGGESDGDGVDPGGAGSSSRWAFSAGLALALVAGLVPILLELPFLTQAVYIFGDPLPTPVYDEFEVASALAFDVGVYFVVVGGLLTIVRKVGEE